MLFVPSYECIEQLENYVVNSSCVCTINWAILIAKKTCYRKDNTGRYSLAVYVEIEITSNSCRML